MFPKYVLLSICAFIRVHFGRPGKFSQHSPFRCTHIFSKTSYDQWFFSKKSWKSSLFKSMSVFQLNNLFFFSFFLSFSYLLSFSLTCSLLFLFALFFPFSDFYFLFFCFLFVLLLFFLDDVPKRKTLHGSRISNIIDSNDINTNATIQTKMYALYKWQSKQQKQTLVSQVKTIT